MQRVGEPREHVPRLLKRVSVAGRLVDSLDARLPTSGDEGVLGATSSAAARMLREVIRSRVAVAVVPEGDVALDVAGTRGCHSNGYNRISPKRYYRK